jgi:hypothetical protein
MANSNSTSLTTRRVDTDQACGLRRNGDYTICGLRVGENWNVGAAGDEPMTCTRCENRLHRDNLAAELEQGPSLREELEIEATIEAHLLSPAQARSYRRLRATFGHETALTYQYLTAAQTARFRANTQRGWDGERAVLAAAA